MMDDKVLAIENKDRLTAQRLFSLLLVGIGVVDKFRDATVHKLEESLSGVILLAFVGFGRDSQPQK